jgi:DNA-binding NarL/FixJ family response regulator
LPVDVSRMRNPWNLTDRQQEVLSKLTDIGCRKVVAYELGVREQAVCQVLQAAARRMAVRTDMQAVLKFDRWARR